MINTKKKLIHQFWNAHPQYKQKYFAIDKTQNEYPAEVREAYVNFVDVMHRDGQINDELANNAGF